MLSVDLIIDEQQQSVQVSRHPPAHLLLTLIIVSPASCLDCSPTDKQTSARHQSESKASSSPLLDEEFGVKVTEGRGRPALDSRLSGCPRCLGENLPRPPTAPFVHSVRMEEENSSFGFKVLQ